MPVFSLDISPVEADGADAIDAVNRRLLHLVNGRIRDKKTTKTEIAKRLGVNKSTVSRMLRGNQNLTIRTLGELLGAIDYSLTDIVAEDRQKDGQNIPLHFSYGVDGGFGDEDESGSHQAMPSEFHMQMAVSE